MKPKKFDYADVLKRAGVTTLRITDDAQPDDIDALAPALRAIDHANALLKGAPAGVDYNALLAALLPMLIAFIQAQMNKPPAPVPAPAPAPVPAPAPGPTPVPQPTPVTPAGRQIKSFRFRYFHVVRENRDLSTEHFKAILALSDPVIVKDRIVTDCSPFDQFGLEIATGDWTPELEALMFFPNGSQRIRYYGNNREISHVTMSNRLGFGPRIKIDELPEDNTNYLTGEFYGLYYPVGDAPEDDEPDFGRPHIQTPILASLRARR